jgi:uracil-DNA glycosylase
MDSAIDHRMAKALLEWQVALGADEAIMDAPLNRYGLTDAAPRTGAAPAVAAGQAHGSGPDDLSGKPKRPELPPQVKVDAVALATQAAGLASDLPGLRAAIAGFAHCDIRKGARNLVFAAGQPGARVMIVGEAPGRDDDLDGQPFAGRAGELLDRMLAAIDMGRAHPDAARSVYLTTVLPWRPPSDRAPDPSEIAMMLPFLRRHIDLAAPEILVLMGNAPCQALLGRAGITRMRGEWAQVMGRPALPMFHPAALLGRAEAKRDAWADLLALNARLRGLA